MAGLQFQLGSDDFITLQSLLQVTGLCDTGGHAKVVIAEGEVSVDGVPEVRRGKKIRAGQSVSLRGSVIDVVE